MTDFETIADATRPEEKQQFFLVPEKYIAGTVLILEHHQVPFDRIVSEKTELSISYDSKMNCDDVDFNPMVKKDLELLKMLKVFEFYNKYKDTFSIWSCSETTGISEYKIKKIFDKYLKA